MDVTVTSGKDQERYDAVPAKEYSAEDHQHANEHGEFFARRHPSWINWSAAFPADTSFRVDHDATFRALVNR